MLMVSRQERHLRLSLIRMLPGKPTLPCSAVLDTETLKSSGAVVLGNCTRQCAGGGSWVPSRPASRSFSGFALPCLLKSTTESPGRKCSLDWSMRQSNGSLYLDLFSISFHYFLYKAHQFSRLSSFSCLSFLFSCKLPEGSELLCPIASAWNAAGHTWSLRKGLWSG